MFNNNASKIYQRLDNVLKKDKVQQTDSSVINQNLKYDIEKAISSYAEIKPSTSVIEVQPNNDELVLTYSVNIKRIKEFIVY